jgi:hypothetical protein
VLILVGCEDAYSASWLSLSDLFGVFFL